MWRGRANGLIETTSTAASPESSEILVRLMTPQPGAHKEPTNSDKSGFARAENYFEPEIL